MRAYPFLLSLTAVLLGCLSCVHAAEDKDFGISRQTHGSSAFVFRNGKLLHEVSRLGENWTEIFYDGAEPVLVRSGYFKDSMPIAISERFPGRSHLTVQQVSIPGDIHPRRILVGPEIYNRSADGFFEIMPDPRKTLTESTLMGVEFSTRDLTEFRESLLKKSAGKNE
jgi:hypothetical protein